MHERSWLPIWLDRAVQTLKKAKVPCDPNAITIGNHCYFPELLIKAPVRLDSPEHYKIAWLIHELSHVWQFQRIGWGYLTTAINLQLREGIQAYYFGGGTGLAQAKMNGKSLTDFNLEQQGEISRSYYNRLVRGLDVSAWQPFIDEIKKV